MEAVSSSSSEKVMIEKIKELLPQFDPDKKVAIMWEFIRAPIFDYNLLYNMLLNELRNKISSGVTSSSSDHHQEPNNNKNSSGSVVGVKIMQKPTVLRFKVRPLIPPLPPFSAPGYNNVVVFKKPRSSKSHQHGNNKIKVAATTLCSLGKDINFIENQKPLVGHHLMIAPEFSKSDKVAATCPDNNNVIKKTQKPIVVNLQKIAPKRQRIDLDDCYDHDEEEKARPKKKNNKKKNKTRPVVGSSIVSNVAAGTSILPPQELQQIMDRVKGCDPVLVIHKRLYQSDVNPGLARLSLPLTQVNPRFLTDEEKNKLLKDNTIDAQMFEPCGEQCVITLTKWNMTKSCTYNLIRTWNEVVRRNGLEQGTQVQLWSFRAHGDQLCMFLAKM